MAIKQTKAGNYAVDYYYFDSGGKRRRKLKTFKNHKEALSFNKQTLARIDQGEFVAPSKQLVKESAISWLEKRFANNNYERSTRIERENHVYNYIISAFGSMPIQSLTVERIERQSIEWNQKVAAMVVNRVLRTLAEIMAEAKRYKIIKDNPAKEAKRLKEANNEVTPEKIFTKDELKRAIESTEPGSMEKIMVMLPALTGCRVGEMLGASWNALDLKAGKFDICTTMADPDKGKPMVFKEPKTQNSRRVLPLPKELIHELRLWKLKCPPSERDLLIASNLGKPVSRRVVARLVQRLIKELGITKPLTPHSFRHTFASLLLARKVAIPEVSRLLGHKNSAITLTTYAHFTGEETNAVHDLASSILS